MATGVNSLVEQTRLRVVPDNQADSASDANLLLRINWAIREIVRLKHPPEMQTYATNVLVAGSASYGKPTDVMVTLILKVVDQQRTLIPMTLRQYGQVDETLTGQPYRYLDYGAAYILYPIPDAGSAGDVMKKFYVRVPTALVAGNDCNLPEQWDESIVCGAAYQYLRDQNEWERAAGAKKDYQMALSLQRRVEAEQFVSQGGRTLGIGR